MVSIVGASSRTPNIGRVQLAPTCKARKSDGRGTRRVARCRAARRAAPTFRNDKVEAQRRRWTFTKPSKLSQKLHIVFIKYADIANTRLQHGDSFDPQAERETAVFLRIISDETKHFRVNHPGTQDL